VLAPVGPAAALGEAVAVLGEETGVPGAAVEPAGRAVAVLEVFAALGVLTGPAVLVAEEAVLVEEGELAGELQAVNRTATHARDAQDATCRVLSTFVISMMSNPSINE
jgi:hypothetical protein